MVVGQEAPRRSAVVAVVAVPRSRRRQLRGVGVDVGPRSMAEVGEAAVARFVAELMAECASGGGGAKGSAAGDSGGGDGEVCDEEGSAHRLRAHREESQR